VRGDAAARDPHPDRGDLLVADPHAGVARDRRRSTPKRRQRPDQHLLERADVVDDTARIDASRRIG
jgi:hypothetical protein